MLRGGAYKPRTSPYSFQGLGLEGLGILQEAKERTGLPVVTELMDAREVDYVAEVADVIQIGARNMQNYNLLTEVGRTDCAVLLKRGLSATLEELLMASEYVLKEGNERVMLCERGIRTHESAYRFTLDLLGDSGAARDDASAGRSSTRAMPQAGAIGSSRCRWPPPRPVPMASSSRCTPSRKKRSATAPRPCARTSSPATRSACAPSPSRPPLPRSGRPWRLFEPRGRRR